MSPDLHHNYWNLLVIRMSLEELHYNMSLLVILWLQLKLIRYNEDEKDLKWFLQVADEENVLVKRSASTFQCSLCPKYQCLHCNKFFSQSPHLRMHIKQVHAKIRDHQCQLCNYAASENQSLIRHLGCYCNLKYCRSFCNNIWTAIEFRNIFNVWLNQIDKYMFCYKIMGCFNGSYAELIFFVIAIWYGK